MKATSMIEHLFIKEQRRVAMRSQPFLTLRARFGIEGDINAHPSSPRQVLLVAKESLDKLKLSPGQLRENIVTQGLDMNSLHSGSLLQIGERAIIRITFLCETCQHIGPFSFARRELEPLRGFLGVVLHGGIISLEDPIQLLSEHYSPIPATLYERFVWLVKQIPFGKVMTYKQLMNTIGGSSSYFRVIPAYIKRAAASDPKLPLHRLVDSQGRLLSYIDQQSERLRNEGVVHTQSQVDAGAYFWQADELFYLNHSQAPAVQKELSYVS